MRKRLRKKKCLGEFTKWARQLVILRNRADGLDAFLRDAIEVIKSNECRYGGAGGQDYKLEVVVELKGDPVERQDRIGSITSWLEGRADVDKWILGEEFDLWHGDSHDELYDQI